jgi:hypothetical protein
LINRVDPEISRHELEITSRRILPHDEEAIEELQALRKLGVAPEKLIETFGEDGLARLERLEARQIEQRAERAKVIDAEIVDNEIVEAEELSIESEDDF